MEFLSSDQEKITGVKRNRLQQWMEQGWIKPSRPADGHGTRNKFSTADLCNIAIFKKIVESGWSRKVAAEFISKGGIRIAEEVGDSTYAEIKTTPTWGGIFTWDVPLVRGPDGKISLPIECYYGVFLRKGGAVKNAFFAGAFDKVRGHLDMLTVVEDMDDVYIINLVKIVAEVSAKIKKVEDEKKMKR